MNLESSRIPIKTTKIEKEILSPVQKTERMLDGELKKLQKELKDLHSHKKQGGTVLSEAIAEAERKITLLQEDPEEYAQEELDKASNSIFGRRAEKKWGEVHAVLIRIKKLIYTEIDSEVRKVEKSLKNSADVWLEVKLETRLHELEEIRDSKMSFTELRNRWKEYLNKRRLEVMSPALDWKKDHGIPGMGKRYLDKFKEELKQEEYYQKKIDELEGEQKPGQEIKEDIFKKFGSWWEKYKKAGLLSALMIFSFSGDKLATPESADTEKPPTIEQAVQDTNQEDVAELAYQEDNNMVDLEDVSLPKEIEPEEKSELDTEGGGEPGESLELVLGQDGTPKTFEHTLLSLVLKQMKDEGTPLTSGDKITNQAGSVALNVVGNLKKTINKESGVISFDAKTGKVSIIDLNSFKEQVSELIQKGKESYNTGKLVHIITKYLHKITDRTWNQLKDLNLLK